MNPSDISMLILLAMLSIAVVTDLKAHLIPNVVTLNAALIAVIYQSVYFGWEGVITSIAGFAIGFCLLLPFYLLKGMRGGDLKLMGAVGAFLGFNTLLAVGFSLVIGSILGVLVLMWRRGGLDFIKRYWQMINYFAYTGLVSYQAPARDDAAATSFPYALAIAGGALMTLLVMPGVR